MTVESFDDSSDLPCMPVGRFFVDVPSEAAQATFDKFLPLVDEASRVKIYPISGTQGQFGAHHSIDALIIKDDDLDPHSARIFYEESFLAGLGIKKFAPRHTTVWVDLIDGDDIL